MKIQKPQLHKLLSALSLKADRGTQVRQSLQKIMDKHGKLLVTAFTFAIVGTAIAALTHATTPTGNLEAEDGTASSCATKVTDSSASNNGAIKFGGCSGASGTYSFASSGLTGGGFQNVLAVSPFKDGNGNRPYLMGADVSGVNISTNQGKFWTSVPGPIHIAAVMWSDTTHGKAFVGSDEGLYESTDWGMTWAKRTGAVDFDGNGGYQASGSEHPRPTGNLLAQDNSGSTKYLWVGTATQGIKQSTNDGNSWNVTALAGEHIRSIASDPNNPDILYVATRDTTGTNSGIWKSINARAGTMSFTKMSDFTSTTPEEMWPIDQNGTTKLYVVSAEDGVSVYDGTNWTSLNNGVATGSSGATWESITGYIDSQGHTVLYIGATDLPALAGNTHRNAIMKSTDGGSTWVSVTNDAAVTVDTNMYGTTIPWWLRSNSFQTFAGNAQWTAAYIAIDPDTTSDILVAGRGGAWIGVQGSPKTVWQPADAGLMVTVNMAVAVDPANPLHVINGNMDFTFEYSADKAVSFTGKAPAGAPTTGDVVVYDANPDAGGNTPVYLAASPRGTNTGTGAIYSATTLFSGGGWTDEALPVSNDVPAMSVGHDSGNQRIILAGVTQLGFWRKAGATWSQVTGGPFDTGSSGNGYFAWKPNTPIVYAIDSTGVWRSNSAGAQGTWIKILAASATYGTFNALALDPTNSNYLYVSDGNLKRISNAATATGTGDVSVSNISGTSNAGPVVITTDGKLIVHDRTGAQLLRSDNPRAASPVFTKVSDAFFAANDNNIRSMAIGSDNTLYTADNGDGLTVGTLNP
jgi:hypothetical protein